jgi:DnaK suppressor protein
MRDVTTIARPASTVGTRWRHDVIKKQSTLRSSSAQVEHPAAAKPAPAKKAGKAPSKPTPSKPATGKTPVKAAKPAPKPAAKTASKAAPKSTAKAPAKPAAKPVKAAKAPSKAPVKSAAKTVATSAAKSAPKSPPKAPIKAPVKTPAKSQAKAPTKPPVKAAALPAAKPVTKPAAGKTAAKAQPDTNPKSAKPTDKAAAKPQKATPSPVEKVANKPSPAATAAVPSAAKAAVTPKVVTPKAPPPPRPANAKASSKSPVRMPLPAVPTQDEQASRFADRFAPTRPAGRTVADTTPEAQKLARKDPKLVNAWQTKPGSQLSEPELLAMSDDVYMNEQQLDFFRKRLNDLKNDLITNAGETTEHLREDTTIVPDPADRATIEEEHALELRTRDRERKLLKKITQSLARIEQGDYGYCDETGEPIGVARLLARPTATLSLEAQQRRELKQRMFGD